MAETITIIIRETHWKQTDELLKILKPNDIIKMLNLKPHHATLIECETCQQPPDQPCKTRTGNTTTPHHARKRALIGAFFANKDNNYTIHEQPTYPDLQHSDEVASAKI